jgi:hypothetical protein
MRFKFFLKALERVAFSLGGGLALAENAPEGCPGSRLESFTATRFQFGNGTSGRGIGDANLEGEAPPQHDLPEKNMVIASEVLTPSLSRTPSAFRFNSGSTRAVIVAVLAMIAYLSDVYQCT